MQKHGQGMQRIYARIWIWICSQNVNGLRLPSAQGSGSVKMVRGCGAGECSSSQSVTTDIDKLEDSVSSMLSCHVCMVIASSF